MPNYPTISLQPGQSGQEVKQLQDYLVSQGYMTQAQVNTGYGIYGPQTKAAVAKLQSDLGVDTAGYPGYWGPKTLSKLTQTPIDNRQYINDPNNQYASIPNPNYGKPLSGGQIDTQTEEMTNTKEITNINETKSLTGDPAYDEIIQGTTNMFNEMVNRGEMVNPDITITDDQLAELLAMAESQINPYYQTQIKLAREELLSGLGYTRDEILAKEKTWERQYGTSVRQLGESKAEQGFALSGGRKAEEQELATSTQEQIDALRRQGEQTGGQAIRSFAQLWSGAPGYETPEFTIAGKPTVSAGTAAFSRSGQELPLYSLSPSIYEGLVGEAEKERLTAKQQLGGYYEEQMRKGLTIPQIRTLNL